MPGLLKNTKTLTINLVLTTFLLALLFGCQGSKTPVSSHNNTYSPSGIDPNENPHITQVVKTARSFIGTKYLYGGSTKAGTDCSGLMYTSFKTVDITLPRTATAQSQLGNNVKIHEIQRGDLLFFTDKKGNSKITHVGLVTDVSGHDHVKFVHASTHAGVVEANLYDTYYLPLFIKAVRLF